MKTLLILRHAKSSWEDASLADFDRPLNDRGKRAAPFMGELMRKKGLVPDVILSSLAKRAKKTAELAKQGGELAAEIVFDERIYEASPRALRQVVAAIDDKIDTAMIVGHNPGMEGFVRYLAARLEPLPTASLAVVELNVEKWNEIEEECGELLAIYRPRDEMK